MAMYTDLISAFGTKSQKNSHKRDCRWNEVKRCCFGCMLGCIKTSGTNKHLTIASSSSCPNTRDSFTAQNCVFVHVGCAGWAQGVTGVYRSNWLHISSRADVNGTCKGPEKETGYVMVLISGRSINEDLQLWMCPWVPHKSGRMGWPVFGSLRQLLFSPDLLCRSPALILMLL